MKQKRRGALKRTAAMSVFLYNWTSGTKVRKVVYVLKLIDRLSSKQ